MERERYCELIWCLWIGLIFRNNVHLQPWVIWKIITTQLAGTEFSLKRQRGRWIRRRPALASDQWRMVLLMCSSGGQTLEPENIKWKDQKNRQGKWYSVGSSWGKQRRQRGRRPGHCTEYSAHVFNVKTSPAGSCPIFPQSTWAPCPKQWDFLCIQVTGCKS